MRRSFATRPSLTPSLVRAARLVVGSLVIGAAPYVWASPSPPLSCDGTPGTGGCPPYGQIIYGTGRTSSFVSLFEYDDIPLDYSETGPFGMVRGAVDLAKGELKTFAIGYDDGNPSTGNGVSMNAVGADYFTLHRLGTPSPDFVSFSAVMTADGIGQIDNLGDQGLAFLNMDTPAIAPTGGISYDLQYFQAGRNVLPLDPFAIHLMSFMNFSLPVEQPFQLDYSLRTDVGESMVFDLSHTARLSFVLPAGVTITSMGGYSSATVAAVPEPSIWLLMVAGLAGIAKLGRTNRLSRD